MKIRAFAVMTLLVGAVAGASTLVACSSDDETTSPASDTITVHVTAASGGTVSDPDGKATLTIPPGALEKDTDITLTVSGPANGSVTSVFDFGPDGLQFLKPATLALKIDGVTIPDGKTAAVALLEDATWKPLDGSKRDGGSVTADITHFSKFAAILVDESGGDGGDGGNGGGGTVSGSTSDLCLGENHACVVSNGEVLCWGDNGSGDLGRTTPSSHNAPPGKVPGLSGVKDIACGGLNTCVLLADGTVSCWGKNGYGQLGNGELSDLPKGPTPVTGITNAMQIAVGISHACALLTDGSVKCWGDNTFGQLGDGATHSSDCVVGFPPEGAPPADCSASPVTAALGGKATMIAAGGRNTCAVLETGDVKCWGAGREGQIGNGGTENATTPTDVSGVSSAVGVSVGSRNACAWTAAGTAMCWGYGEALGDGQETHAGDCTSVHDKPIDCATTPVSLAASSIMSIGPGARCAIKTDGTAVCWGPNGLGQAGDGSTSITPLTTPAAVTGLSGAKRIAAAFNFTCARTADQTLCWGWNDSRKLGSGESGDTVTEPTPVEL